MSGSGNGFQDKKWELKDSIGQSSRYPYGCKHEVCFAPSAVDICITIQRSGYCFWRQLSCLYVGKLTYCSCNNLQQHRAQHETLNSAAILGKCSCSQFGPIVQALESKPRCISGAHTHMWFATQTKLKRTVAVRWEWKSTSENSSMRLSLSLCKFRAIEATELEILVIKAWNEALGRRWVDSMS